MNKLVIQSHQYIYFIRVDWNLNLEDDQLSFNQSESKT